MLQAVCPNSRVFKFLGDAAISAARLSGSTAYPSPSSREESRTNLFTSLDLRKGGAFDPRRRPGGAAERRYAPSTRTPSTRDAVGAHAFEAIL
mgnify:CR=1 FL=1